MTLCTTPNYFVGDQMEVRLTAQRLFGMIALIQKVFVHWNIPDGIVHIAKNTSNAIV